MLGLSKVLYLLESTMINQAYSSPSHCKTPPSTPNKSDKSIDTAHSAKVKDIPTRENEDTRIVNLIGYDRLLSSIDTLAPIVNKWGSEQKPISSLLDRFIPNRKLARNNYDRKQYPQTDENNEENDPQSVSITQIFSEEILGGKSSLSEQEMFPFRNKNILRFGERKGKRSQEDYEHPLGVLKNAQYQRVRKISKMPCKVLDAPALQDDFYLNLIDWSCNNQLAVGLGNCIYLWNAQSSKVTKLCELQNDLVTSVGWAASGNTLAVGCNRGQVLLWDVNEARQVRSMLGHQIRVGAIAWNTNLLATGSRDKTILLRDVRARRDFNTKLSQHTQEICGLKWSLDEQYLASGGNDNKVAVWSQGGLLLNKFTDHRAAVKALAWSPQQHGLLASGGGTADRMLRLRNVFTGEIMFEKDTGSQICNLSFSKHMHQIVSTHGYSQNQINIWSYPRLKKIATLIGHTHRVLYLASSPDGNTIVTGAGDETLRFWNIFSGTSSNEEAKSKIFEGLMLR